MTAAIEPAWLGEVVACALCGGTLAEQRRVGEGAGVLQCEACRAPYPVIGTIAVLVPEPHVWMAAHRADIVELLEGDRASLEVVDAFASSAPDEPAQPFVDDWLPGELTGEEWPDPPADYRETFGRFIDEVGEWNPVRALLGLLGPDIGTTVEIGIGAGRLSTSLLMRAGRLVIADLSLRTVLAVLERDRRYKKDTPRAAIIADAEQLPLRPGAVDFLAAANLIDLLDDPAGFLAASAAALRPGGRIGLVTPAPDLGDDTAGDGALDAALLAAGFVISDGHDQVPWLRAHRAREWQVYFTRIVVATRPPLDA
ncbi:MAG TPA: methyltransferase domain-containing protein [Kofleriaceae bacterium]|nr:methyltransferase domain-containing protein [Kofleriaceae bacterium]